MIERTILFILVASAVFICATGVLRVLQLGFDRWAWFLLGYPVLVTLVIGTLALISLSSTLPYETGTP